MSAIKSWRSAEPQSSVGIGLAVEGRAFYRYIGVPKPPKALVDRYVAAVRATEGELAQPIAGLPSSPLLFRLIEPLGRPRTGFHRAFRTRSAIAMALVETAPSTCRYLHPDGGRAGNIMSGLVALSVDVLVLPVRAVATLAGRSQRAQRPTDSGSPR